MNTTISLLPSKSIFHRVSVCNFIQSVQGFGTTQLKGNFEGVALGTDMQATTESLKRLHALVVSVRKAQVRKQRIPDYTPVFSVGDSGATLRFLLPLVGVYGTGGKFRMTEGLYLRPIESLLDTMENNGCTVTRIKKNNELVIGGQLLAGAYEVEGNESSQFVSGLMMALPILEGDSEIIIKKPLVSKAYVDMTIEVLNSFGVSLFKRDESISQITYHVHGNQLYRGPKTFLVESDWSAAAFWLVCEQITGKSIFLKGLGSKSKQGDRQVMEIIRKMEQDGLLTIDCVETPDIVPVLAVLALTRKGNTLFQGVESLAFKESDRIAGITSVIQAIGGQVEYSEDGITVHGDEELFSKETHGVKSRLEEKTDSDENEYKEEELSKDSDATSIEDRQLIYVNTQDHRMVMMAVLASLISKEPVIIDGWRSIGKSYPKFFKDLHEAGLNGNIGLA